MKLKSLLLSLLATISLSASALEVNWKPIPSYNFPGTKGFIDIGATQKAQIRDTEYTLAFILIVSDKEFTVNVDNKPVNAKSTVKKIVVECSTATMTSVADYIFDIEKPINTSEPVAQTPEGLRNPTVIPKSHFIYVTLCTKSV